MTILRILGRRWYVVVPTLAVTAIAVVGLISIAEPEYETSASVILVVHNQGQETPDAGVRETNPYLDMSGSLVTTANVVADVLNGQPVRSELYAAGHLSTFEVLPGDRVPTLSIRAWGPDAERVHQTVEAVMARVGGELTRLQDAVGAAPDRRIAPAVLVPPTPPLGTTAHVGRAAAVTALLGLLATISLALIAENAAASRRERDDRARSGGAVTRQPPDGGRAGEQAAARPDTTASSERPPAQGTEQVPVGNRVGQGRATGQAREAEARSSVFSARGDAAPRSSAGR